MSYDRNRNKRKIGRNYGTGWLKPIPDLRDFTPTHPEITDMSRDLGWSDTFTEYLEKLRVASPHEPPDELVKLPSKVDLRQFFGPVRHQGEIGSCTAQAAVGLVDYFERRSSRDDPPSFFVQGSPLFVYKTTRNLKGEIGDTGSNPRDAIKALKLCGCVPERYWLYTDAVPDFDEEPSAFVYSVANNYRPIKYFSHETAGQYKSTSATLFSVKAFLAMGIPSMFGFAVYDWCDDPLLDPVNLVYPYSDGKILPVLFTFPLLCTELHGVVAVGYDDSMVITREYPVECSRETTGALLIRNSWGREWGEDGYGWLPYQYIIEGAAEDFWSILSKNWIDTNQFGI